MRQSCADFLLTASQVDGVFGSDTRLHRARKLVRKELDKQIGFVLMDAFPFAGRRCERLTNAPFCNGSSLPNNFREHFRAAII